MAGPGASIVTAVCATEVAAAVARSGVPLQPVSGGTKVGERPTGEDGRSWLDVSALQGILDYQPSEFTVTVRAGTTLDEIDNVLAAEGQYLPFDPPRFAPTATVGGTVAAGLSGPCRLRYGGVRDFILAVEAVDGLGRVVRGGCPVVKNSAGFDLPKLLVGSWGTLAVILQLTMKVFPRPQQYRTVRIECPCAADALRLVLDLARSPIEIDGLDLLPSATVLARVSGDDVQVAALSRRISDHAGRSSAVLEGDDDERCWRFLRGPMSTERSMMIRVPLTADRLLVLEQQLSNLDVVRRYCAAGNVAWIWIDDANPLTRLDALLASLSLPGRVVRGPRSACVLGARRTDAFADRVRIALDPQRKFFDPNVG